jgi:hypothetical protein
MTVNKSMKGGGMKPQVYTVSRAVQRRLGAPWNR